MKELDLTVFENGYDPHNRGKQCIRELNGIKANKHPNIKGQMSEHNQEKLLDYAAKMIDRIREDNFTVPSFEKNLGEAWKLCLFFGGKNADEITGKDLAKWWEVEKERYRSQKISYGTLQKEIGCCNTFLKFLKEPKKWGTSAARKVTVDVMADIYLPNKPRPKLRERLPSQEEVKRLLEAMYVDGKRMSIRNMAICSFANDSGARISAILSIRNKHIRPEENYLVVDLPHSKTAPRTIIAFLSKKHLENWAKVSPNKEAGPDAFFFCQANGNEVKYPCLAIEFRKALKKTGIPWKRNIHYFRHLFISRTVDWPYAPKMYWTGLALKGHERTYSHIDYTQCLEPYFTMLKKEQNPILEDEPVFWNNVSQGETMGEKLLTAALKDKEMKRELASLLGRVAEKNGFEKKVVELVKV